MFFGSANYRRPGSLRIPLAAAALALVFGAAGFFILAPSPHGPSRLERVPNMDSTPGGERQRESQRYRETLRSSNFIRADEADRSGNSYMSVPEGLPEQTARSADPGRASSDTADDLPAKEVSAQQAAERVAAATETSAQRAETGRAAALAAQRGSEDTLSPSGRAERSRDSAPEENPFHAAILRQMSAVARAMEIAGPSSVELISEANAENMAWPGRPAAEQEARMRESVSPAVLAGSVLQGEVITMIDSDVPAPVAVRVTSGPVADGVLIGRFAANSLAEGVSIEFSRLSLPTGQEIAVQAMALDRFTMGGAVHGEVDPRPVQRYGPLMVSSFVSGFAANAARPPMTLLNTANGVLAATEKPTIEDNLIAGAGQAASAAASDLAAAAPKSPRIRVRPGKTVSILFLSQVSVPSHSPE